MIVTLMSGATQAVVVVKSFGDMPEDDKNGVMGAAGFFICLIILGLVMCGGKRKYRHPASRNEDANR